MPNQGKHLKSLSFSLFCAVAVLLSGCGQVVYYWQAGKGQMELWREAKPVKVWLDDPATPVRLRDRLAQASVIRRFASQTLGLPDNDSYRSYADLNRAAVVWNVFAAPADSLTPHTWCFPVAGCVPYRGYYSRADAVAFAAELDKQGLETYIGPVTAYSTLGWFDDPLLNTFINNADADLARLIFHELAHQLIYVPGDAEFNEGFAGAVERIGVDAWLKLHGTDEVRAAWEKSRQQQKAVMQLLTRHQEALRTLYATSGLPADQRQTQRTALTNALRADYLALRDTQGMDSRYDRFFAGPLNNAQLSSFAVYTRWDVAFERLYAGGADLQAFYAKVKALAAADAPSRLLQLGKLTESADTPTTQAGVAL